MNIKEGYITENQALAVAIAHYGRPIVPGAVTGKRKEFLAEKIGHGVWICNKEKVCLRWPRGAYKVNGISSPDDFDGYVTEKEAHEIASSHNGREVSLKTVTNKRSYLCAKLTANGWIYDKSRVLNQWPRGASVAGDSTCVVENRVENKKEAVVKSVKSLPGCGELHFHNCSVNVYFQK